MQIIRVSDPSEPVLMGSYDSPGYAFDVFVIGNYAYLADWFRGVSIINISNRNDPFLAGRYEAENTAYSVFASFPYVYIADSYQGLQVINISNPSAPWLIDSFDTPSSPLGVFVSSEYIYVADSSSLVILTFTPTAIGDDSNCLPTTPTLAPNYPNPFNARTTISFSLPAPSRARLDVFDITGRSVGIIAEGECAAGEHRVVWDAGELPSGIYFYRLRAGEFAQTRKMTLIK
jgi:hypothetical protein